jgi:glucokinase
VGGTNARFALLRLDVDGEPMNQRTLRVRDFPSAQHAAEHYLADETPHMLPGIGIVAVAAPSRGDRVSMTNCDWDFSVTHVGSQVGIDSMFAMNDYAAVSWGMLNIDPAELVQIGDKPVKGRVGRFVAVGAGTGLGVGTVTRDGDGRMAVVDTEGGHVDFAPATREEDAILAVLRKHFGRVSCERLLSGPGLVNIYDASIGDAMGVTPEHVTELAAGGDRNARRAIDHFCAMLGTFAGNVALMHSAYDGVFLAGGLVRALESELSRGIFRERFEAKGRFSGIVADIPTVLIPDPWIGLRGAAAALRSRLAKA